MLRTICAVLLIHAGLIAALMLWDVVPLWLLGVLDAPSIVRDTMALAVPLASPCVGQATLVCGLPPITLACWAGGFPLSERWRAAWYGLGMGLLLTMVWQSLMTLYCGDGFALRYAVQHPVTTVDLGLVGVICLLEVGFTLYWLPLPGGPTVWRRIGFWLNGH